MNPVAWLELRIRAREHRLWVLVLFATFAYFIPCALVCALSTPVRYGFIGDPAQFASGFQYAILFIQLGLLGVFAPLSAAGRISQEREQRTFSALRNSPISDRSIVIGKFFGSIPFLLWMVLLPAPLLAIGWFWGGPSAGTIASCLAANFACAITITVLSLAASAMFQRTLTAYLVTGAFLFGWVVLVPLIGVLIGSMSPGKDQFETIAYFTFYYHPTYPIVAILGLDDIDDRYFSVFNIAYCFAVWATLSVCGFLCAVHATGRDTE